MAIFTHDHQNCNSVTSYAWWTVFRFSKNQYKQYNSYKIPYSVIKILYAAYESLTMYSAETVQMEYVVVIPSQDVLFKTTQSLKQSPAYIHETTERLTDDSLYDQLMKQLEG